MADGPRVGVGVGVLLLREGKALFGMRSKTESYGAGTWSMPGGKIEWGETLEDAAIREVLEETGIIVRSVRVLCVNNDRGDGHHFVTVGLIAESFVGEPKATSPDELTDWRWFPLDTLPDPMFGPSRGLLDCYLGKRVNKY